MERDEAKVRLLSQMYSMRSVKTDEAMLDNYTWFDFACAIHDSELTKELMLEIVDENYRELDWGSIRNLQSKFQSTELQDDVLKEIANREGVTTKTFEELKLIYPVGTQATVWGDIVPESAHSSIEEMAEFILMYVANDISHISYDNQTISYDTYE